MRHPPHKPALPRHGHDDGKGWIHGIHPIHEALRAGRRPVKTILLAREKEDAETAPLLKLARTLGVALQPSSRESLDKRFPGAVHQGIAAEVGPYPFVEIETLAESPVIVILDGIEDPHNFGAIVRAGVALGVGGFVIAQQRSAPVSAAANKASAGAIEHARIAKVGGIPQALANLKRDGRWLIGLAMAGDIPVAKLREYRPLGLVIGAEGEGLHRLAAERCDGLCSIKMHGPLESLNASTAAAIAIHAALA